RPEYGDGPSGFERVVILGRNDTADHNEDIGSFELGEFGAEFRDEGAVASGKGADADDMDVVFDGLASGFGGALKEWADVNVEADVGEGRRNDFLAAIVAILSHFGE